CARHTRYMITRAPGAIPLIGPRSTPYKTAESTRLPAAVELVCVPCPSESRAEQSLVVLLQNSPAPAPTAFMYVLVNAYAPTSLRLQGNGAPRCATSLPSPNWQLYGPPGGGGRPRFANDGCSGQMPVSITPTTTPEAALSCPPSDGHTFAAPVNCGVTLV